MRILVTGGSGFIGSHLAEKLLTQGHEVICLDNFISGSFQNIQHLQKNPEFHFVEQDITNPLKEDPGAIDQIYHLACPGSPHDLEEIPLQILWSSAAGTKRMLELASKTGASFLLASSAEVYGEPQENPQKETYVGHVNTLGKSSSHQEGKRFAETMAYHYYQDFRFPFQIARIFDTYGPRMRSRSGHQIADLLQAALLQEPLRLAGDGLQQYFFCYVDDVVEGLMLLMNQKEFLGPVNLGNPQGNTLIEIAEKIITFCESSSIITHVAIPKHDAVYQPDITLAREKLGFEPQVGLDEGLKLVIANCRLH
jgi:UDP-glucuronate decarboxylase